MKKVMRKINDWLLFGKKKEDYVDFIISKVRIISEIDNRVSDSIAILKKEKDACMFERTLKDVRRMEWLINDLKMMADIYKSSNKYIEEITDKIDEYKVTLQLICYGAKFL